MIHEQLLEQTTNQETATSVADQEEIGSLSII